MAEKRVIEYEAASELANDDWLLIDGVTEGTRKARPNVVTAELGAQVTNLASTVGGLTQVAMGHEQSFAPSYDESESYDVGDLVMQYHGLYRCTAATTGTWDAGKWTRTEVSEQLEESGKIDDVQVNGTSVVTDKVANIDLTDMQDDIDSKVADVTIGGESIVNEDHVLEMDNFISKASIPSGAISTFGNAMALPMPSLTVGIEAVQSGNGDPSPTNVRPISGFSAVNVYDTGVNIWDEEWEVGGISTSSGQDISLNAIRSKGYSPCKPSTAYHAKFTGDGYVFWYDADKNYIGNSYSGVDDRDRVVQSPYNAYWFRIRKDGITTYNNDISINYPSTDIDYHAYNGTTYTTTLKDGQGNPMTCYGGQLTNENGVQRLDNIYGYVDLGTLNWTLENGIFRLNESIGAKLTTDTSAVANMLCSIYKTVSQNAMGSTTTDQCVAGLNWSNGVRIKDSNYTDVTSFKQAMDGVQLVYELATPQTIPQDNLAIATQEGTNNLWADSGDVISGEYYSKFETSNVYSTDEKAVGVDVDGKTRYQKTYLNLGSVSSYTFSDLTNVSTMFVVSEGSKLNGGLPFPYIHPDSDNVVGYFFDLSGTNPKIEIRKGSGSSGASLDMLTIQYTK